MIPSYGVSLRDHPDLIRDIQTATARTLNLADSGRESGKVPAMV